MAQRDIIVVGAGIGGLSAALDLASRGYRVTVVERAPVVGGKMRTVNIDGRAIDSGPTVLTMRNVFDRLFERAGVRFDEVVTLRPLHRLARHAWTDGSRLDLFTDPERSAHAIADFAGASEAEGFRRFCAHTQRIYETVRDPFIYGDTARFWGVVKSLSLSHLRQLAAVDWHRSMWKALTTFFRDPRLRQLFARYATYYGSSPFYAPATLNLIAHVEQRGVWAIEGGMIRLAQALAAQIEAHGGEIRLNSSVEEILVERGHATGIRLADGSSLAARSVVLNAPPEVLTAGRLGPHLRKAARPSGSARSLCAITWSMVGTVRDFPLAYHNVLFSDDYHREFEQLRAGVVPHPPTVYVCAQDRDPTSPLSSTTEAPQRLFCLVNAPARGDDPTFNLEIDRCQERCFEQMSRCGMTVEVEPSRIICTTPHDFDQMFPGSGGALYGPATHGMMASFSRPGTRTKVRGLYLTGGSVHPGAGVPMVALSGRLAARSAHEDLASTLPSRPGATCGGTSTASVPMVERP